MNAETRQSDKPDDDSHQGFGVMTEAVQLLRRLAGAPQGDLVATKQAAKAWVERFDEAQDEQRRHQRHRHAPDKAVDAWIFEMFRSTESAITREQLVGDFVQTYRKERRLVDHDRHAGPWLFEFRLERDGPRTWLAPVQAAGVHAKAFDDICAEELPQWQDDPYLLQVFEKGGDIDAQHPLWHGESRLFNRLLDVRHRAEGEPDYWVNAVALQGDGLHATRGLFLLHPNGGTLAEPRFPPGLKQDQRLLLVLSLAWRQLAHQIKGLAMISEADRRVMIKLLAPGVLYHEVGNAMLGLNQGANTLQHQLQALAAQNPEAPWLTAYGEQAAELALQARQLYNITDAFNNLDKRSPVEDTQLGRVCTTLRLLCRHRLGECGVDLRWDEAEFEATALRTDAVLLTQALLNLVANALNAFAEGQSPPPRRIRLQLLEADAKGLALLVANNGPAIEDSHRPFLFQRGVSSRATGHGQGLYLSRLIARYLGGELRLVEGAALPSGFKVGFRLSFLRELPTQWGVSHATLQSRR